MELGHLLTRSGLTHPEVSSKVCQLANIVGNAIPKHAGPQAEGSNPTTGLTLLWARNPFGGNFNHWQVSRKEAGQIFFTWRHGCEKGKISYPYKMCVWFPLQLLSETFLILKRIKNKVSNAQVRHATALRPSTFFIYQLMHKIIA
jgi:hypothetical protein